MTSMRLFAIALEAMAIATAVAELSFATCGYAAVCPHGVGYGAVRH